MLKTYGKRVENGHYLDRKSQLNVLVFAPNPQHDFR